MANYLPNPEPAKHLLPLIPENKALANGAGQIPILLVDSKSLFCCTMPVYGSLYTKTPSTRPTAP